MSMEQIFGYLTTQLIRSFNAITKTANSAGH